MWLIRLGLFALLVGIVVVFGVLVRNRGRCHRILENRAINVVLVTVYNLLCYAVVALPAAGSPVIPSDPLLNPRLYPGFLALGALLIPSGIVLAAITAGTRRAIGGQDVRGGLMTSGVYRYFRHPIYTGIVWICLGLPLVTRNADGLMLFPGVLGVNLAEGWIEEKFDVGARFPDQYEAYRRTTAMFGPRWIWCLIVATLAALMAGGLIVE